MIMEHIADHSAPWEFNRKPCSNKDGVCGTIGEANHTKDRIVVLVKTWKSDQKNLGPEPGFIFDGGAIGSLFHLDFPCILGVVSGKDLQSVAAGLEVV
jgi:hypothetical protein